MASRVGSLTDFAPLSPPWLLTELDQNTTNIAAAFNDSSLGYVNAIATDVGTSNNYIVTCSFGSPTAYNQGMTVVFIAANTNTGASTITVSPLGSFQIVDQAGDALVSGMIQVGQRVALVFVGTSFTLMGPSGSRLLYSAPAGNAANTQLNCAGYTSLFLTTNYITASSTYTLQLDNLAAGVSIVWQHGWNAASQHVILAPYSDGGTTIYNTSNDFVSNTGTLVSLLTPGITRGSGTVSFFTGGSYLVAGVTNNLAVTETHT